MAAPIQVSLSSDASLEQPAASALDSTHGQPSGPPWSVPSAPSESVTGL